MSRRHVSREQLWVILREDRFHDPDAPASTRINVKAIVDSEDLASAEVARLNALHPDGRVVYFQQLGRYFSGATPGFDAPPA